LTLDLSWTPTYSSLLSSAFCRAAERTEINPYCCGLASIVVWLTAEAASANAGGAG